MVLYAIMGEIPIRQLLDSVFQRYQIIELTVREFNKPFFIDLLLGTDVFPQSLDGEKSHIIIPGSPSAVLTKFGWLIFEQVEEVIFGTMYLVEVQLLFCLNL